MTSALFEILAEPNRHEHVVFDVIADLRHREEIPQAPGDLPGFRS